MTKHILVGLLAIATPAALSAQTIDIAGVTPAMDPSVIAHGILVSNIPRQAVEARQRGQARAQQPSRRSTTGANLAKPRAVAAVPTSYRPAAAISAQVDRQLIAQAEKVTPGAGKEMRDLLTSGHVRKQYHNVAATLGLSPSDAADALAFYVVAQWGVATDYREMITPAQMKGVRSQVRALYPKIATSLDTDAKRQVFAETLIARGVVGAGIHEAAVQAGNEARVKELVQMTQPAAREILGTDPARFELTEKGLVPKGN